MHLMIRFIAKELHLEMTCSTFATYLTDWVSQAILITGNLILFAPSSTGRSLVIYLVWSKTALRSPTYLLTSFLALSNLLTSLFGQSSYCTSVAILKDLPCSLVRAMGLINVTSCVSSLLLLSLIARNRYLGVCEQQDYLNHTSNRFAITASIASCLFGMIVASLLPYIIAYCKSQTRLHLP